MDICFYFSWVNIKEWNGSHGRYMFNISKSCQMVFLRGCTIFCSHGKVLYRRVTCSGWCFQELPGDVGGGRWKCPREPRGDGGIIQTSDDVSLNHSRGGRMEKHWEGEGEPLATDEKRDSGFCWRSRAEMWGTPWPPWVPWKELDEKRGARCFPGS